MNFKSSRSKIVANDRKFGIEFLLFHKKQIQFLTQCCTQSTHRQGKRAAENTIILSEMANKPQSNQTKQHAPFEIMSKCANQFEHSDHKSLINEFFDKFNVHFTDFFFIILYEAPKARVPLLTKRLGNPKKG